MHDGDTKEMPIWVRWASSLSFVVHAGMAWGIGMGGLGTGLPAFARYLLPAVIGLELIPFALATYRLGTYWPGLVGVVALKGVGALVTLIAVAFKVVPASLAVPAILFDLLWGGLLVATLRELLRPTKSELPRLSLGELLEVARDQHGNRLGELTKDRPALVVCLRHFGCTFCREALADLAKLLPQLEEMGTKLVLVHMGNEDEAAYVMQKYGLEGVSRVSDPLRRIYRALELRRGNWWQLFGPAVWLRGWKAGVIDKHGIGKLVGDGFQMPGVFLVWKGQIVREYRHPSAADRPDYLDLAGCRSCPN